MLVCRGGLLRWHNCACVIHFLYGVCESMSNNANVVVTGGSCGAVILLGLVRAYSSHLQLAGVAVSHAKRSLSSQLKP